MVWWSALEHFQTIQPETVYKSSTSIDTTRNKQVKRYGFISTVYITSTENYIIIYNTHFVYTQFLHHLFHDHAFIICKEAIYSFPLQQWCLWLLSTRKGSLGYYQRHWRQCPRSLVPELRWYYPLGKMLGTIGLYPMNTDYIRCIWGWLFRGTNLRVPSQHFCLWTMACQWQDLLSGRIYTPSGGIALHGGDSRRTS